MLVGGKKYYFYLNSNIEIHKFIIERTNSLPFIARVIIRKFLSRKRMVDIIETTLQKFSNVFGTGRKIDIKGNEEDGEN